MENSNQIRLLCLNTAYLRRTHGLRLREMAEKLGPLQNESFAAVPFSV